MIFNGKKFEFRFWVIEPHLGLHQHAIFWLPVCAFIFCGLLLSLPLWCWCIPSVTDYEQIMKDAAYPIFVASLAIPLGVMIGRFHGSAQRKLANDLSNSGMSFNRFYEHRKHFYDFIKENYRPIKKVARAVYISDKAAFYRILFPLNSPENNHFEMDDDAFRSRTAKAGDMIQASITHFQQNHSSIPVLNFEDAMNFIDELLKPFGLAVTENFQEELSHDDAHSVFGLLLLCIKESLKEGFQFAESDSLAKLGWSYHLSLDACFSGYKTDKDARSLDAKLLRAISIY